MKISSFVHLDAKFCEFHVFSVEFSNRYYSKFLMKIPYVFKGQTNFVSFMNFYFLLSTTTDK